MALGWWIGTAWGGETRADLEAAGRRPVEPIAEVAAPPLVLRGATVYTGGSDDAAARIADGYVVVRDGRIAAVGSGAPPEVEGATVLDVRGRFVTPALVDTHSHLGVYPAPGGNAHEDGNEMTRPLTPGVWAEHGILPQDPGFRAAIAGGVATLQVLPGSANLMGGRGVVVRTVPARGGRAMRFPGAPETVKMACGENPKRIYGERGGPQTRMGNLHDQREAFVSAVAYARRWDAWDAAQATADGDEEGASGKKKPKKGAPEGPKDPPERDLDQETLVGVLKGEILPQVHCYRADDLLSFLQVADEFGFQVRSFHHATDGYKVRDVLAARGVGASVWADWWGFKLESYDAIPEGAALLDEAGVRVAIHSDSAVGVQRLNQEAAKALAAGQAAGIAVTEADAIRWITANPAWILGIDGETGTLEVGKRADLVVWDHPPLSVYASADLVFVDGALRWDRARPAAWSDLMLGLGPVGAPAKGAR